MASEAKLGTVPPANATRDAVHVAVYPVEAGEFLEPGHRVAIVDGKAVYDETNAIGIVDPFRSENVQIGKWFYLCLFPGSTIGMVHHWKHPAFDGDKAGSEAWLRAYAAKVNTYDESPDKAFRRLIDGLRQEELFYWGSDLHGFSEVVDADELKRHGEIYLGKEIDWSRFSFSCSC